MFIAVEGPDGSGKSSLIEEIASAVKSRFGDVDVIRHHKGKPPEETRRCLLMEYAINYQHDDVFSQVHLADRWHWGERTYAPIKRPHTDKDGYGLLGMSGWRWVELFMQSRGMTQFLIYQSPEVLKNRIRARGDDFVDESEIDWIYGAYMSTRNVAILSGEYGPNLIPPIDGLRSLADEIVDKAILAADSTEFLSQFPEYIGVPRPSVLLVGDRRNITDEYGEETILPFMPVAASSGHFLLSCLPDDLWKNVGIVNGNDVSPASLESLHKKLGSPPIAALGRMAENAVLNSSINDDECTTVPHPQYVRRFHSSELQEYGLAIQSISKREDPGQWKLQ